MIVMAMVLMVLCAGIDYTGSNYMQGKKTFGGKCLHHIDPTDLNPYQKVRPFWTSGRIHLQWNYYSGKNMPTRECKMTWAIICTKLQLNYSLACAD